MQVYVWLFCSSPYLRLSVRWGIAVLFSSRVNQVLQWQTLSLNGLVWYFHRFHVIDLLKTKGFMHLLNRDKSDLFQLMHDYFLSSATWIWYLPLKWNFVTKNLHIFLKILHVAAEYVYAHNLCYLTTSCRSFQLPTS